MAGRRSTSAVRTSWWETTACVLGPRTSQIWTPEEDHADVESCPRSISRAHDALTNLLNLFHELTDALLASVDQLRMPYPVSWITAPNSYSGSCAYSRSALGMDSTRLLKTGAARSGMGGLVGALLHLLHWGNGQMLRRSDGDRKADHIQIVGVGGV